MLTGEGEIEGRPTATGVLRREVRGHTQSLVAQVTNSPGEGLFVENMKIFYMKYKSKYTVVSRESGNVRPLARITNNTH